jgi:hypothetical protein
MKWIGPCAGFMSFNPLKAQIELAFANAPVGFPDPENATSGVPGGPCTSPARAALALRHATAAAQIAAANVLRMTSSPFVLSPKLATGTGRYDAGMIGSSGPHEKSVAITCLPTGRRAQPHESGVTLHPDRGVPTSRRAGALRGRLALSFVRADTFPRSAALRRPRP